MSRRTGLVTPIFLVHAWKGDTSNRLSEDGANFNPMMATAASHNRSSRASGQAGRIDGDHIVTPGIYVQRIVHVPNELKRIEQRTTRKRDALKTGGRLNGWTRDQMAARRQELKDGFYVNLGIGIPTLVSKLHPSGNERAVAERERHTGDGAVRSRARRTGPHQRRQTDRRNCRRPAFFSADSFAMIRGGHIDLAILGAMQVAENGDLANWMIPGRW